MIIGITGYKGGVGKTTTAVHLAAYLAQSAPTVLVDGDTNRSALLWARAGKLPFETVAYEGLARAARNFEHIVIDSQARPRREELQSLADNCDFLVLPTNPESMSLDAMLQTAETLEQLKLEAGRYRILLTLIPPAPSQDGLKARSLLEGEGLALFPGQVRFTAAFRTASERGVVVHQVTGNKLAKLAWMDYEGIGKTLGEGGNS